MANEAIQVEGEYIIHDFTVAASTGIKQGALLILSDPRTAATGELGVFAGVAMTEKDATSDQTELGLCTDGIFTMTAQSGTTIVAGAMVIISGTNTITNAAAGDLLTGLVVGKALEDIASNTTGEVHVGASA